jgi:pimeloyl-ACP methyl ester carboxylesterase
MKARTFVPMLAAALLLATISALSPAGAQSDPRFIRLASKVKGALYMPDSGPAPKIGVMLMHEDSNFLAHIGCTELSKRGYAVLCVYGRSDNNEAFDTWNELLQDAALGMRYLREQVKVEKVVLLGHSGGGPLMSFYQAVAENGPEFCRDPRRLLPCKDDTKPVPKADGMIFFDAHPGTGVNMLRGLDPSILNEDEPTAVNSALDAFNPANGFNPKGASKYSEEFKARYFKAQADRMNRLIDTALERKRQILAGTYKYPDDDVFAIPRQSAKLTDLDPTINVKTLKPRKLIKNDGTVVTEIVTSVKKPNPDKRQEDNRSYEGSPALSVLSFLATRAIRAKDSMDDYDIYSNSNSTELSLMHIHVPILMMAAGGHYYLRDDERMFEAAVSPDKDYAVTEGATHGFTPCKPCETTPGQYSNTVKNTFDYMKAWIDKRFAS